MDFHHRDPNTKKLSLAELFRNTTAWTTVLDEIKKCDLLCACCHRIRTYGSETMTPLTSAELTNASLTQRVLTLETIIAGLQARFNKLEEIVNEPRDMRRVREEYP
jgi:hypothetical protein